MPFAPFLTSRTTRTKQRASVACLFMSVALLAGCGPKSDPRADDVAAIRAMMEKKQEEERLGRIEDRARLEAKKKAILAEGALPPTPQPGSSAARAASAPVRRP